MSTQSDKTREQLDDLLERGEISRETFAEYSATADTALSAAPHTGGQTHNTAPTKFVEAVGIRFAYRRFGTQSAGGSRHRLRAGERRAHCGHALCRTLTRRAWRRDRSAA